MIIASNLKTLVILSCSLACISTLFIQPVFIGDQVRLNNTNSSSSHYYNLILPTLNSSDLVVSASGYTDLQIQVTVYAKFLSNSENITQDDLPTSSSYDKQCSNTKLVACLFQSSLISVNQISSIVLLIQLSNNCVFLFEFTVITPTSLSVNTVTNLSLIEGSFVSLMDLPEGQEQDKQFLIIGEYQRGSNCPFRVDLVRKEGFEREKESVAIAADARAIKINPKTYSNSQYMVIVIGKYPCDLSLSYSEISNKLQINQIFWYMYDHQTPNSQQFNLELSQPSASDKLSINIQISMGSCTFVIDYCQNQDTDDSFMWSYTYANQDGKSGEIIIPSPQRQLCQNANSSLEVIRITLGDMSDVLFFVVTPLAYMGDQRENIIQGRISMAAAMEDILVYDLLWIKPDQELGLTLSLQQYDQDITRVLSAQLYKCNSQGQCSDLVQAVSNDNTNIYYQWNPSNSIFRLHISSLTNSTDPIYQISLTPTQKPINQLYFFTLFQNQTMMNNIDYYQINYKSQSPNSAANSTPMLSVGSINGEIGLLVVYDQNQLQRCLDITESYTHQTNINIFSQDSQIAYICIKGLTQSLYSIEPYMNQTYPQPQPQPEEQLVQLQIQDGANTYNLSQEITYLLKYNAHFYPYNVSVDGTPDCLQIYYEEEQAYNLHNHSCLQMISPTKDLQFWSKQLFIRVYYNSNSSQSQQLTIQITLPKIQLSKFEPIVLTCSGYCQTDIIVKIQVSYGKSMTLKHYGGILFYNQEDYQDGKNSTVLVCPTGQVACQVTLQAILPFGGTMFIEDQQIGSQFVTWEQEVVALTDNAVNLLIELNRYSSIDTLLLKYEGACIDVTYSLFQLNTSSGSYSTYQYFQPQQALFSRQCIPFQQTMTIQLSSLSPHCSLSTFKCFITMSIIKNQALFPVSKQPSLHYALHSQLQHLILDTPAQYLEIYGVKYFEINDSMADSMADLSHVTVIPLSLCSSMVLTYEETRLQVRVTEACKYVVVASVCGFRSMVEGVGHRIEDEKENAYFVLQNTKNKPFKIFIQKKQNIKEDIIYVGVMKIKQGWSQQNVQCSPLNRKQNSSLFIEYKYNQQIGQYLPTASQSTFFKDQQYSGPYIATLQSQTTLESIRIYFENPPSTKQIPQLTLIPNQPSQTYKPQESLNFKYYSSKQHKVCMSLSEQENWDASSMAVIECNQTQLMKIKIAQMQSNNINQNCKQVQPLYPDNFVYQYKIRLVLNKSKQQSNKSSLLSIQVVENPVPHQLFDSIGLEIINGMSQHCFVHQTITTQSTSISLLLMANSLDAKNSPKISATPITQRNIQISTQKIGNPNREYYQIKITSSQSSNKYNWCISEFATQYTLILNKNTDILTLLPTQQYSHHSGPKSHQQFDIYQIVLPKQPTLLQLEYKHQEIQPQIVNIIIEVVSCGMVSNQIFNILGTTDYEDISSGKISEIEDQYRDIPGKYVAMGVAVSPGYYYLGIKHKDQGVLQDYSLRTFIDYTGQNPYKEWVLAVNRISSIEYHNKEEDNSYLTITLPKLIRKNDINYTESDYNFTYVLIISNSSLQQAVEYAMCPHLTTSHKQAEISQFVLENPQIPIFKLKTKDLNSKIGVWGTASVSSPLHSQPLTYFYEGMEYQVPNPDNEDSGDSNKNLLWLVGLVIIGIFVGILIRFLFKVFKRKRNTVQFQMSENTQTNQNPMINEGNNSSRRPDNRDTGYGQFVDEIV